MRSRPVIFAKLRSPGRARSVAWVAVLALLVQTLVGAPLAARMMIDAAWNVAADPAEALCTAHEGADVDGAPHPAPASGHHDHEHCVLCQASAAPLLVAPAAPVIPAPVFDAVGPSFFYALAGPEACCAHDAEARAPPRR